MILNAEKNYSHCAVFTTVSMESWANLNIPACIEMLILMEMHVYVSGYS